MIVHVHIIKSITSFRYLVVTLAKFSRSNKDFNGKMKQEKIVIGQLNSMLRSSKIIQKTKKVCHLRKHSYIWL